MDLNKVNPKAAESLEIVAIWKKKKRKEDGFNIVSLIDIYIYIYIILVLGYRV